jgi:protocatechuate 3,4-dioxygenase alpha subunit
MTHKQTPSQTAGPYVHIGCSPNLSGIPGVLEADLGVRMITGAAQGQPLTIRGCIFDGAGAPLCDAVIEAWQADANGVYPPAPNADPHFAGFGRVSCDSETGAYVFQTIRPGRVPFTDGRVQAPHITLWIVARGINLGLHTRVYLADEDNTHDPLLNTIGDPARVGTLMARADKNGDYVFNIHLQGPDETVFLNI